MGISTTTTSTMSTTTSTMSTSTSVAPTMPRSSLIARLPSPDENTSDEETEGGAREQRLEQVPAFWRERREKRMRKARQDLDDPRWLMAQSQRLLEEAEVSVTPPPTKFSITSPPSSLQPAPWPLGSRAVGGSGLQAGDFVRNVTAEHGSLVS
jgi:hypothetical protein